MVAISTQNMIALITIFRRRVLAALGRSANQQDARDGALFDDFLKRPYTLFVSRLLDGHAG